jgi:dTDP-4-amino-4,6-dideoxygalactose transaminase
VSSVRQDGGDAVIPLVDLAAQHREIAAEVDAGWASVVDRTAFILGDEVERFERELAAFVGVKHCIAVANGSDALELILRAAGVGAGDEVVLPVNTFVATALAVVRAGATPVFVDCDPLYHLIDVFTLPVGPRAKAIVAVHLYGQMAPVEAIAATAPGALLVEDAAQAHGATRLGRPAGASGLAAATSFYPAKNLGAYGDGGAVLTDSEEIAAKIRVLRQYGSASKYHHPVVGMNSRLDTLQAVVLRAKLKRLAAWNAARRAAARRYDDLLASIPGVDLPRTAPGNEHVWHLYTVRVPRRDEVLATLTARGIGAAVHYPIPLHLQGAFAHLGHRPGDFPVAEGAAAELLSLPLFPHVTAEQQARVAAELRKAVAGAA